MSRPKVSASYPSAMMSALMRAHKLGEVRIPTKTPLAMRLEFQGFRGALRKEGKGEIADQVSFHAKKDEDVFIIRLRSNSPLMSDIEAALAGAEPKTSAVEEAEKSLNRILGGL